MHQSSLDKPCYWKFFITRAEWNPKTKRATIFYQFEVYSIHCITHIWENVTNPNNTATIAIIFVIWFTRSSEVIFHSYKVWIIQIMNFQVKGSPVPVSFSKKICLISFDSMKHTIFMQKRVSYRGVLICWNIRHSGSSWMFWAHS